MPSNPVGQLCAAAAVLVVAGCSGGSQNIAEFSEVPPRITRATLSGPLCESGRCTCAGTEGDPGLPTQPGVKRFEFHVGPSENELWVSVDDMILYKTRERASECFYLDLAHPQKHPVKLRATGENGFAARLTISELGPRGSYDTFEFHCGGPGTCEMGSLHDWQASLARYTRSAHDPCGSTKIRQIAWKSGRTPDRLHPEDLELELVLDVYEFAPKHPSGHAACKDAY